MVDRALPSDQQLIKSWQDGIRNAQDKAKNAVNAMTVAPGELAAAQSDKWQQNVSSSEARSRFENGSRSVSLDEHKSTMINKGIPRAVDGATKINPRRQRKQLAAIRAVAAIGATVRAMPNKTDNDADQRMLAQVQAARKLKGTLN